jgi:hypothetical protein
LTEEEREVVDLKVARNAIASASRRVALLHLAYARTLVDELGEERGKMLVAKAIKSYGIRIGEVTKKEVLAQGLELTPGNYSAGKSYAIPRIPGMHDRLFPAKVGNDLRYALHGCVLGKVWKEYGEEKLGRLYCYVDVSQTMGYNPMFKLIHIKATADGDSYCELAFRPTTEQERKDFAAKDKDWLYLDHP